MCSKKEVKDYFHNYDYLLRMKRNKFVKMVDLFAANCINVHDVLTYPDIFKRKYETVQMRIDGLKQNTDLKNIRLSMINVSQKEFSRRYKTYVEDTHARQQFRDKCGLLMKSLNCSEAVAASLIDSSTWLDNSKLSTIQKKLDLYLSADPELVSVIQNRIWLLSFPLTDIEVKLNEVKRLDVPTFIWKKSLNRLMKSTGKEYTALLQRMVIDRSVYDNCISKEEYLCKHLECNEAVLRSMIVSYPHLLSVNIAKLQNHLTFLRHEFGFSNKDIIVNARVFKFSEETLRLRFYELQKLGPTVLKLHVLIKDGKNFVAYLSKLKESFV